MVDTMKWVKKKENEYWRCKTENKIKIEKDFLAAKN
jgi:hypothetical protein